MRLEAYLENLLERDDLSPEMTSLAKETLERWKQGIVPDSASLRLLSKSVTPATPCANYGRDGACGWLRKNATSIKVSIPPVGEPAICCFTTQSECPGYRRS